MKQRYTKVPLFLALFTLLFYLPTQSYSQCSCADGTPAQTVSYNLIGNITPSIDSTTFVFPKFDPASGTLLCVNAQAYVTSVVRMRLENDETFPVTYAVRYARTDQLTGPGISPAITGALVKNFGPYNLGPTDESYFSGPDYKVIGPDTVYKNKLFEGTTSNVISYLGPGTISFTYKVAGSTNVTGSSNYIFSISANDRIDFHLTYSYCESTILPLNLKEFVAVKKDEQSVMLSWTSQQETNTNPYEIQFSTNGQQFTTIGTKQPQLVEGLAAKYQYQHNLDQPVTGKLYYRIRQSEAGKPKYTGVRFVIMKEAGFGGFTIFPNPVRKSATLQFDKPLNGDYLFEIHSLSGQVILSRILKVKTNTNVELAIDNPPAGGMYLVRARNIRTKETYTGKIVFGH
jgi:hypothetical protein